MFGYFLVNQKTISTAKLFDKINLDKSAQLNGKEL